MWVVAIKNRQALPVGEAGIPKSFDQTGKLIARKKGSRGYRKQTEIQDGLIDAAFATRAGDGVKCFFAAL
jgi:hypothetical protein